MSDSLRYSLLALIVLLTHFQEGVTGFGCTVLALPFVALLLGLKVAVPLLVTQAWILALMIVIESRRKIVWREFVKIVLLVGLGLPVGIWMSKSLPETGLKWVLAAFMLGVGGHGLAIHMKQLSPKTRMSAGTRVMAGSLLPLGGIIHGAFGSGGPLVVVYAARAIQDKTLFRVTLCLLWLTLNTTLIIHWAVSGSLSAHTLRLSACCVPFTLAGMVLGNAAHYRINELLFRRIIYSVLIASGAVLVWSMAGR